MRRRDFVTLLGGAAAGSSLLWPLAARAQQPALPVIGFLSSGSPAARAPLVAAFHKGLSESGYVEGRNVTIEYRWAQNDDAQLLELASDLVHRQVAVIATLGGTPPPLAAKAATTRIPIVFGMGGDPLQLGLVASLNRPGGNVTGVNYISTELEEKRLGLLYELLPQAARFAFLVNLNDAASKSQITDVYSAASVIGRQIEVLTASTNHDIDTAFSSLVQKRTDALMVSSNPLFMTHRVQVTARAAHHAVPTIYAFREFAESGGLMSYGASLMDQARQTGIYTARILKGEKPADLPILRATKFEFVINLKTAKTLGLDIPPMLLARVDEVIE